jgi:hypothetical protein
MQTEFITNQDQLEVFFSKCVSPEESLQDEEGHKLTGIHIPSSDVQATLKRKQRTRRVHVLSFEIWDGKNKALSHIGVITNTANRRVYKPQVHRSSVNEVLYPEGDESGH